MKGRNETLAVEAPEDLVADLRAAVQSGAHASLGDLVREALNEWRARFELERAPTEHLRTMLQQGIASGAAAPLDMAEIKAEGRRRLGLKAE